MTTSTPVVDTHGNIWINLYRNEGLYCFNTKSNRYTQFFESKNILNIFFGEKRSYLLSEKFIYSYDSVSQKMDSMHLPFARKYTFNIRNAYEDNYHRIWLPGTMNGLFCFDFSKKKVYQYRHDNAKQKSISTDYITVRHATAQKIFG